MGLYKDFKTKLGIEQLCRPNAIDNDTLTTMPLNCTLHCLVSRVGEGIVFNENEYIIATKMQFY